MRPTKAFTGAYGAVYADELGVPAWQALSASGSRVEIILRAFAGKRDTQIPGTKSARVEQQNTFAIPLEDFARLGQAGGRTERTLRRNGQRIRDELIELGFLTCIQAASGRAPGVYELTRWESGGVKYPGSLAFLRTAPPTVL